MQVQRDTWRVRQPATNKETDDSSRLPPQAREAHGISSADRNSSTSSSSCLVAPSDSCALILSLREA
ncbi:hypothetical protein L1887_08260 [Cichorium endivia]|nr:hypothetical protein L1887_08260 [Cichorium endivia]